MWQSLLYWAALDCIGIPDKVYDSVCVMVSLNSPVAPSTGPKPRLRSRRSTRALTCSQR